MSGRPASPDDGAPDGAPDEAPAEGPPAGRPRRDVLRTAGVAGAALVTGTVVGMSVDDASSLAGRPAAAGPPTSTPERLATEARGALWADDRVRGTHRIIWDVATDAPLVALTFDDGPDPAFTPRILDALAAAGARATFFMMGRMLEAHPELGRRVLAEGHEVGNHTWSHETLTMVGPDVARDEILRGKEALRRVLGSDTTWFRPPRGQLGGTALRVLAEEGYDTVVWSVSRQLAEVGTPEQIAAALTAGLRPGAVVDLHDSIGRGNFLGPGSRLRADLTARREVEVAALPAVLAAGAAAGLRFVTVGELVAAAAQPGALSPAVDPARLAPGPTASPPAPA